MARVETPQIEYPLVTKARSMDTLNAPHIARQIIRTNVTREQTATSAHRSRRGIVI